MKYYGFPRSGLDPLPDLLLYAQGWTRSLRATTEPTTREAL
jgi:hypothetical protein